MWYVVELEDDRPLSVAPELTRASTSLTGLTSPSSARSRVHARTSATCTCRGVGKAHFRSRVQACVATSSSRTGCSDPANDRLSKLSQALLGLKSFAHRFSYQLGDCRMDCRGMPKDLVAILGDGCGNQGKDGASWGEHPSGLPGPQVRFDGGAMRERQEHTPPPSLFQHQHVRRRDAIQGVHQTLDRRGCEKRDRPLRMMSMKWNCGVPAKRLGF